MRANVNYTDSGIINVFIFNCPSWLGSLTGVKIRYNVLIFCVDTQQVYYAVTCRAGMKHIYILYNI